MADGWWQMADGNAINIEHEPSPLAWCYYYGSAVCISAVLL
jgi:hypothetical protein